MPKYMHYLRTGSGTTEVQLRLEPDSAELDILSHWMLTGLQRFKLSCRRVKHSDVFGALLVEQIEIATQEDGPFQALTLNEEELLLPLVIEYLTVPQCPVLVHDASQLIMMRQLGYATWNDFFDLVLMVHDFEWRAEKSPLLDICSAIDKKKFAEWTEEAQAKQAARERDDHEMSLWRWSAVWTGKTG